MVRCACRCASDMVFHSNSVQCGLLLCWAVHGTDEFLRFAFECACKMILWMSRFCDSARGHNRCMWMMCTSILSQALSLYVRRRHAYARTHAQTHSVPSVPPHWEAARMLLACLFVCVC